MLSPRNAKTPFGENHFSANVWKRTASPLPPPSAGYKPELFTVHRPGAICHPHHLARPGSAGVPPAWPRRRPQRAGKATPAPEAERPKPVGRLALRCGWRIASPSAFCRRPPTHPELASARLTGPRILTRPTVARTDASPCSVHTRGRHVEWLLRPAVCLAVAGQWAASAIA